LRVRIFFVVLTGISDIFWDRGLLSVQIFFAALTGLAIRFFGGVFKLPFCCKGTSRGRTIKATASDTTATATTATAAITTATTTTDALTVVVAVVVSMGGILGFQHDLLAGNNNINWLFNWR
jgi:hypothetical protein